MSTEPRLSGTRVRIIICAALNRPFAEWSEVFPNAACVVSIVDRLIHHAEILVIEGESYRMREAKQRAARNKAAKLRQRRTRPTTNTDTTA
jgi:DNA replication protein DnaC